jgi:hypothetical protein
MTTKMHLLCATNAAIVTAAILLAAGCASQGSPFGKSDKDQTEKSTSSAPAQAKSTAGMNDKGEVIDSSKVQAGQGKQVKGLGEWQGEITGKPAPNSKFTKLQIGMPAKQVTDIVGQPSDQGAYVTGKAWIPFYFGSDRHRFEMVYKGQGRLIFAGGSVGDWSSGHLIWIIHNANEPAYR